MGRPSDASLTQQYQRGLWRCPVCMDLFKLFKDEQARQQLANLLCLPLMPPELTDYVLRNYIDCPIYSIEKWNKLHDAFVPYYEAIDINHIFICITTRQLLSACKYSSTLAIDCTYKITWNELPLLVFGTSDLYRHFHPLGLCLISTDESADTFKTLFRVLKSCVPLIIQQPYDITHVMADGTAVILYVQSIANVDEYLHADNN
ncbi:unnamed protein product [Didymodactylos carnosus]|uniref:MULE transposase domain-containing protein n=1 Tax=Didymodactylos carnosus TaxID=1234261 RepID=A0A814I868_9BILA|nr:unnamed protein product [Didymodactylos carnosus]CAF3791475.1 unnamed protein product [Didymodactylos carnosus]